MGESDRYIGRKKTRISIGDDNNGLMALIAINAIVFICFGLIKIIYQMSQSTIIAFEYEVLRWAVLPAKLSTLAHEPWTVLTYMFVHNSVIISIVNLMWLWAFGSILQNVLGNKVVIPVYLYGGLAGALFFIATAYAVPTLREQVDYLSLFGANASIFAVAIAATTITPNYKIFPMLNGGISLWIITLVYVVISIASGGTDPAFLTALGGGALIGFLFINNYQKGRDWSLWMNELFSWFINLFEPGEKRMSTGNIKNAFFYKTGERKPFIKSPAITQEKIDLILDKINQQGYNHLTEEEKSILKKASEEEF